MSNLMPHYRTSEETKEILRLLQRSGTSEGNFFWQSTESKKRIVPIKRIELDFVARDILVAFDSYQNEVDMDLPLFFKLDTNQTVFKVTEFSFVNGEIHFPIPEEVKTLELRSKPRKTLHPDKEKTFSLKPVQQNATIQELKVRAVDISVDGLGILVSEGNRSFLRNNRILWLTELGEVALRRPILAEVVYLQSHAASLRANKNKEVRAGLKLSGIIPDHALDFFCDL